MPSANLRLDESDILGSVAVSSRKKNRNTASCARRSSAPGTLVPEYHRATPECPHPERWSMYDSMTAEVEVLEFLRTLVTTIKPTWWSKPEPSWASAPLWIAEAMRAERLRPHRQLRIRSQVFETATEKIDASDFAT